MKVIGKSLAFYKKGIGIDDQSKMVFSFYSVFGLEFHSNIINCNKISKLVINKLLYSHYTGGKNYRGNISANIENTHKVYDLELLCETSSVLIIKRNKDKELVNKYANFLSEQLGLKIELRKIELDQYQTNNLSRQINDE